MIRLLGNNALRVLFLVLFQFFLNLIHFTTFDVTPSLFILAILLFPFETPGWLSLLVAFLMGILVDWQCDSMGQHAFAAVFVAGIRPVVLTFIAERSEYEKGTQPRMSYFGFSWALRYAFFIILAYSIVFYAIESFTFEFFGRMLAQITINTILTTTLVILSQYWFFKKVA